MLSKLPLEILRRICIHLSPEAALCFAHSCQQTYHSCDDWIVWRSIVKQTPRVRTKLPGAEVEWDSEQEENTMANAGVVRSEAEIRSLTAVEQYMPQLITLGCKFCHSLS